MALRAGEPANVGQSGPGLAFGHKALWFNSSAKAAA